MHDKGKEPSSALPAKINASAADPWWRFFVFLIRKHLRDLDRSRYVTILTSKQEILCSFADLQTCLIAMSTTEYTVPKIPLIFNLAIQFWNIFFKIKQK